MKGRNIVKDKSKNFAIRIINLRLYLTETKNEYIISKQIVRSGTSVGAMIREAEQAESNADFIHKLSIALKEINETIYWLELLEATEYISNAEFNSINDDALEIIKLLTSIIKTSKSKTLKD